MKSTFKINGKHQSFDSKAKKCMCQRQIYTDGVAFNINKTDTDIIAFTFIYKNLNGNNGKIIAPFESVHSFIISDLCWYTYNRDFTMIC